MSTTAKAVAGIAGIVVVALGVWLLRPLFVDTVVDEDFPLSVGAVVPADMTQEEVEAEMVAAAEAPPVEQAEPMPPAGPVALRTGTFAGADSVHSGAGTATVYELDDGSRVLRFEDFTVTNGPDLRVYLGPLGEDGVAGLEEESVELGRLKGNVGSQNYDIPADLGVDGPLAVVIYCQPFQVTFATASLS